MPRDGSGNYTLPYPAVVDGTTIESAVHNGTMSDIALQLNGPVPIIAGGTGANNAHDAMIALKGEIAQQPVTNYDTFPFADGSFYSVPGATNAPSPGYLSGLCYGAALGAIFIEVRDFNNFPNTVWLRNQVGGIWSAWAKGPSSEADLDARYVNLTGDTMTGSLNIYPAGASAFLNITGASGAQAGVNFNETGAAGGWQIVKQPGGNSLLAYDTVRGVSAVHFNSAAGQVDVGYATASSTPSTGALTVAGGVGIAGDVMIGGTELGVGKNGAVGVIRFGSTGTPYIFYDGAKFQLSAPVAVNDGTASTSPTTGALTVAGGVGVGGQLSVGGIVQVTGTTAYLNVSSGTGPGVYHFNGSATKYIGYDTVSINVGGAPFKVLDTTPSTSPSTGALTVAGGAGIGGTLYVGNGLNVGAGGLAVAGPINQSSGGFTSTQNVNTVCRWTIQNQSAGSSAFTCLDFGTDLGSTTGEIIVNSSTNGTNVTPSGMWFNLSQNADWGWQNVGGQRMRLAADGALTVGGGYMCRSGFAGAVGTNKFNMQWTGAMALYVDTTNLGNISVTSDYRTKKDVTDLPSTWETVKALRPIKYTQAQFTPPSHVKYVAEEVLRAKKEADDNPAITPREVSTAPMFEADDIERWGFIAHELQETLTPSASTGEKDSPDTIQSPNPFTVIAALTKALQEAMARIEALEAR